MPGSAATISRTPLQRAVSVAAFDHCTDLGMGATMSWTLEGRLLRELLVRRDLPVHVVEPRSQGDQG